MANQLPRPGVQVLQQFRAQTPTVITPRLVPCVVGLCRQVVELLVDNGAGGQTLNTDAVVQMPAMFTAIAASGAPAVYTGLDGLVLSVSINNGAAVSVTFSDPSASGLTPATVVSQVNTSFLQQGVSSARAVTLKGDAARWSLETVGLGEFQSIFVAATTSPVVASAFGIGVGQTYSGLGNYNQLEATVPPISFPDPRGNLEELSIELGTIRAFVATGSGTQVFEAKTDESFLRNGAVDTTATFNSTLQVSPAITYPSDFYGLSVVVTVGAGNSAATTTYTFPSSGFAPADGDAVAALLTAGIEGVTVTHSAGTLTWTTTATGARARIVVGPGTANTLLGLVGNESVSGLSITAVDDGNGDATTSLIEFDGEDFTLAAQNGSLTSATAPDLANITAGMTLILSDGRQPQEVVFTGLEVSVVGVTNSLQATIEAVVGTSVGGRISVSEGGSGELVLTNSLLFGDESVVKVLGGTALPYLDEGTNSAVTSEGTQTLSPNTAAQPTEGVVSLDAVSAVASSETFTIDVDGAGSPQTVDIGATPGDHTNAATLATYIDGQLTGATASVGPGGGLLITSDTTGSSSEIVLAEGTGALAILGLTAGTTNGVDVFPTVGTETFQVSLDGAAPLTVTLASETSFADIKANVEGALTGVTATQGPNGGIVLTGTTSGQKGTIQVIDNGGGGLAVLGLSEQSVSGDGEVIFNGATGRGRAHAPLPGDKLYVDGALYATINQVAPGGAANRLKIDRQVVITTDVGSLFFIQAQDLSGPNSLARPSADLQVSLTGSAIIKHDILRDVQGEAVNVTAPIYVAYNAVRLDTTALAASPGLLTFDDTTQLEAALAPISADNPLALGLFFALVNAPGSQVNGLGVDAFSADAPDGTVEAFTRAAEYLEGFEVYAIAPLTHNESVGQVFNTHVQVMSEPANRSERIVLFNPSTPTRELDELVGSGTRGDGLTTITFDTKITNLSALLQASGVSPLGTIPADAGVFLDISVDGLAYSISAVSGSVVTVRTTAAQFPLGTNDDNFYAESDLPSPLINEVFSVRIRGAELRTVSGTLDKNAVASTVQQLSQSFGNRRTWVTFPDKCRATIGGVEQVIEGYYMNAATAGAIAQQPPQQSFTNFPIAGFTGVVGSNSTYSEGQLDTMAAGGTYIYIQEGASTPIFARMALTSDITSIETRTDSITKVVDFTAKFMRTSLRNFIGRFNITQGFLDTLGTAVQGVFGFLVENEILINGQLSNIVQDENNRDTVIIDTVLDVPVPCNYIQLTLLV